MVIAPDVPTTRCRRCQVRIPALLGYCETCTGLINAAIQDRLNRAARAREEHRHEIRLTVEMWAMRLAILAAFGWLIWRTI